MKNYVLVFVFSPDYRYVLLIRKKRPDWQKGRLNGLGGRIEPQETPVIAAKREVEEESGIADLCNLEQFCMLSCYQKWNVFCFRAVSKAVASSLRNSTDEGEVRSWPVERVGQLGELSNVPWLVSMALDGDNNLKPPTINYRQQEISDERNTVSPN
jgi:8-oxo-dGTP diphosphatase